MSEYAEIKIREMSIWDYRNYLDDTVGLIFSPGDLIVIPDFVEDSEEDDSYQYTKYMYRTTVHKARERLDALGFSLHRLEKEFKRNIDDLMEMFGFSQVYSPDEGADTANREKITKHVSYRKWMNALRKVVGYELDKGNITLWKEEHDIAIKSLCDNLILDSLKGRNSEMFYGMDLEYIDVAYIFRAILEFCESNDEVMLDFSYLQYWSDDSTEQGRVSAGNNEKTIVLVEGTSDKDILEFSLKQIYPHLSDLFYFMDFDDGNNVKRDGGTSYLIKNMKTFYFSRIKTRFIAVLIMMPRVIIVNVRC